MILLDYLSRHRQKDLHQSELIPISFCCLKVYRSFLDDRIGGDIFCIKTRSSAKASGEEVGEVHGANKPLDPNYKPEHQLKLLSVTGKSSPIKTPRKTILKTLARLTPKALNTSKTVKIQSETENDMLTPIPNPTTMGTPVLVHGGAWQKTPSGWNTFNTTLCTPFSFPTTAIGAEKNTFFYTFGREWGGSG